MNKRFQRISKLIEKGFIKEGTVVTIKSPINVFGNNFTLKKKELVIRNIKINQDSIIYLVEEKENKSKKYITNYKYVYKYDGMLEERFVSSMLENLNSSKNAKIDPITGSPVKRGRKPKWYKELIEKRKLALQ